MATYMSDKKQSILFYLLFCSCMEFSCLFKVWRMHLLNLAQMTGKTAQQILTSTYNLTSKQSVWKNCYFKAPVHECTAASPKSSPTSRQLCLSDGATEMSEISSTTATVTTYCTPSCNVYTQLNTETKRNSNVDACVMQLCRTRHWQRWAGRLHVWVQQSGHRPDPAPWLMMTSPVTLDHYPLFAAKPWLRHLMS